jgi:hypothetical protein
MDAGRNHRLYIPWPKFLAQAARTATAATAMTTAYDFTLGRTPVDDLAWIGNAPGNSDFCTLIAFRTLY